MNLGGVQGDGVLWEFEALLDEGGEFADAATLLAEDFLCVRCADDDVGDGWGDADLDAGVTFLGEFALEEFVQLGVEDTVCEERVLAMNSCFFSNFVRGPFCSYSPSSSFFSS